MPKLVAYCVRAGVSTSWNTAWHRTSFHFVEHGLAPDEKVRRWQDRWNPAQQKIAGGCNVNRDIRAIVEDGGLTVTSLETYYSKGEPKTLGSMYEGIAVAT